MLSMIVAMGKGNVIGKDNQMPWHYPEDLRYFKEVTMNKTVIMGSKTYESILTTLKKPLPNRHHVILTKDKAKYREMETYHSIEDALANYLKKEEEVFVIGGASIYKQFLPFADRLYITHINQSFEGDTFFPHFNSDDFHLVSKKDVGDLSFCVYERSVNE